MGRRGKRPDYIHIHVNTWIEMTQQHFTRIPAFADTVNGWLALVDRHDPDPRTRLHKLLDLCTFHDPDIPDLLEHWK